MPQRMRGWAALARALGLSPRPRLGDPASVARGSGRRRDSSPPLRGAGREVAGAAPLRHRRRGAVTCTNSAAERALGRDVGYGFHRNRGRQRDFVQFGEHLSHPVFRGLQGLRPFGSLILSDHPAGGSRRLRYSRIASLPCGASIRASCRDSGACFAFCLDAAALPRPQPAFS